MVVATNLSIHLYSLCNNNTYMYQNSHISIKHSTCLCVSHLYCPQLALKLWHSFDLLPNFCQTSGHKFFVKHWATTHLEMKMSIAAFFLHTDELAHQWIYDLWSCGILRGKFLLSLRSRKNTVGQKGGKATYLQSASPFVYFCCSGIWSWVPWSEGSSIVHSKWW